MHSKFILCEIALKNVKSRLYRSGLIALFVFVLSASLFACTVLLSNMNRGLESTSERLGADIVVVPEDYFSSIENALFTGNPCTVYFDRKWAEILRETDGIEAASSQLFLATLNSECCESLAQLIAFDEDNDFVIRPWLSTETALSENEAAVGCDIGLAKGETVTYYGTEFTVAEVLDKSGMGYDNSVFISYDGAKRIIGSESARNFLSVQSDDFISMVNLKVKDGYDAETVSNAIAKQYDGVAVYTSDKLLENAEKSIRSFTGYSNVLLTVLFVLSTISIMSIFSITVNERKREFGIFILFGTQKNQLIRIIMLEAVFIIIVGTAAGILLSGICLLLFRNIIVLNLQLPYLEVGIGELLSAVLQCTAITFAAGIAATIYSVVKLTRSSGANLLEEGE
ncbi:MAG: ABC transporter permease [Oscillospiraceae bacterium]